MMTTTMTCMEEKNHYANKSEFQVVFKPRIQFIAHSIIERDQVMHSIGYEAQKPPIFHLFSILHQLLFIMMMHLSLE
jgi:hypothetical protein